MEIRKLGKRKVGWQGHLFLLRQSIDLTPELSEWRKQFVANESRRLAVDLAKSHETAFAATLAAFDPINRALITQLLLRASISAAQAVVMPWLIWIVSFRSLPEGAVPYWFYFILSGAYLAILASDMVDGLYAHLLGYHYRRLFTASCSAMLVDFSRESSL